MISRQNVGYLRLGVEYFQNGFVINLAPARPTLDEDRARRALSDALLAFVLKMVTPSEKKPKYYKKIQKPLKVKKNPSRFAQKLAPVIETIDFDRARQALSISYFTHRIQVYYQ